MMTVTHLGRERVLEKIEELGEKIMRNDDRLYMLGHDEDGKMVVVMAGQVFKELRKEDRKV